MRIFSIIIAFGLFLNASEYFAKLEPVETYNIKASTSGQVVYINNEIEGLNANNSTIIKLDSSVDEIDLKQTKNKIKTLGQIIKIEKSTLKKILKIRAKSQLDKDNQKIKVLNLENQLGDLVTKKAILEDKLNKKNLVEKSHYISNINVKVGDFVNAGTLLYTAEDLTKAKLEIFIPMSEAQNIKTKRIYIENRVTDYKINKIYKVADTKHISSYKCEIIIDAPKSFSHLVKIEFK